MKRIDGEGSPPHQPDAAARPRKSKPREAQPPETQHKTIRPAGPGDTGSEDSGIGDAGTGHAGAAGDRPEIPRFKESGLVGPSMPKQTTDVDRLVGIRITALRKARGFSQTALGNAVGVTFQQVQKYEKGQNRVGAGRLREIARLLEVPVSAFFEGSEVGGPGREEDVFGFLNTTGAIDLLRAYAQIEDEQMRRDVLALVRSAARLTQGRATAQDQPA